MKKTGTLVNTMATRKYPAKSCHSDDPIPDNVNDTLKTCLGRTYKTISELPIKLRVDFYDRDDVQYFRHVQELRLSYCLNLIDVSSLRNITRIMIRECPLITDVSSLQNVQYLTLWHCQNVSDISMLRNEELELVNCERITDVSMLVDVKKLHIVRCRGITKISMLKNVKITLSDPTNIVDLDKLDQENLTYDPPRIVFQTHASRYNYLTRSFS
tara:strand:- start:4395 stop:5036 length:642 start_codon:yes stop_codon:yes gene_type:complete